MVRAHTIKTYLFALGLIGIIGGTGVSIMSSESTFASVSGNPPCAPGFLSFPVWYRGLTVSDQDCTIKSPGNGKTDLSNFIWHIVLNCIDIALQLVGYLAAFLILYGGFIFLTSSGEAANIAKAKTTITNAVIGLIISIVSVAIVNLIFGIIK